MSRNRKRNDMAKHTEPPSPQGENATATLGDFFAEPEVSEPPRLGLWSCYLLGMIRLEVRAWSREEAIDKYKEKLNLRRNDLKIDAKRVS